MEGLDPLLKTEGLETFPFLYNNGNGNKMEDPDKRTGAIVHLYGVSSHNGNDYVGRFLAVLRENGGIKFDMSTKNRSLAYYAKAPVF